MRAGWSNASLPAPLKSTALCRINILLTLRAALLFDGSNALGIDLQPV
jgi:hypothetical protein